MWHDKSKYLNCVARYRATVRKLVESFEFGVIISNDSSFLFAGLWTRHSISNDSSFLFAGTSGILNHYATSWIIWEFWFSILSRVFCFLLQMNAHPVYADSIKWICYMCWIMFYIMDFIPSFLQTFLILWRRTGNTTVSKITWSECKHRCCLPTSQDPSDRIVFLFSLNKVCLLIFFCMNRKRSMKILTWIQNSECSCNFSLSYSSSIKNLVCFFS